MGQLHKYKIFYYIVDSGQAYVYNNVKRYCNYLLMKLNLKLFLNILMLLINSLSTTAQLPEGHVLRENEVQKALTFPSATLIPTASKRGELVVISS
jgi:hypothetical protein